MNLRWCNVCSPFLSYVGAYANLLEAGSPRSTRGAFSSARFLVFYFYAYSFIDNKEMAYIHYVCKRNNEKTILILVPFYCVCTY